MPETTDLMKRPTPQDCIVGRRAWELFMPAVKRYLGKDWADSEADYIGKQMAKVLSSGGDGYSMARDLENNHGWAEDRALMELMEEGESCMSEAHKEILGQWIRCYGIAPERKVGDIVLTQLYNRKGEEGVISKIYLEDASYGVRYPDQPETSCYVVEYENVTDPPEVNDAVAAQ